jgi:hypothetical protein
MYRTTGAVLVVLLHAAPLLAQSAWSFTVSPSTIVSGQSAVVSFFAPTRDVYNILISGVSPDVTCGPESCSGTLTVAPSWTTTYTLTMTNAANVAYHARTVTLAVTPPPQAPLPPAPDARLDFIPSGTLLYKENLVYEGSFLAPRGDQGCLGCRFGYPPIPGGGLWYDEESQTLYAAGHSQYGKVGQMTVPELRDARTEPLLSAAALQFGDATDGKWSAIGPLGGGVFQVGGLVKRGDRLCLNAYHYYDANWQQQASFYCGSANLSITKDAVGPVKIGSRKVGETSGYIAPVPAAWQAAVGGTHCVGHWGLSIISRTSMGPACWTTSFASAPDGSIDATPLLLYPYEQPPLGQYDTQNLYNNGTTKPGGMAWPEGTDSLLFFMRHGVGPFCYGSGCNPPLPNANYAPPYVNQVLAFDANALLACRTTPGCAPSQLRPYARWEFEFPIDRDRRFIGGVAYDAARQRVYISQERGEDTTIHAYRVRVQGIDPGPAALEP